MEILENENQTTREREPDSDKSNMEMFDGVTNKNCSRLFETFQDFSPEFTNIPVT